MFFYPSGSLSKIGLPMLVIISLACEVWPTPTISSECNLLSSRGAWAVFKFFIMCEASDYYLRLSFPELMEYLPLNERYFEFLPSKWCEEGCVKCDVITSAARPSLLSELITISMAGILGFL